MDIKNLLKKSVIGFIDCNGRAENKVSRIRVLKCFFLFLINNRRKGIIEKFIGRKRDSLIDR